jgi:hypothetical protein
MVGRLRSGVVAAVSIDRVVGRGADHGDKEAAFVEVRSREFVHNKWVSSR